MTDMQIIQNFLEGVQESGKTTTAYDTTAEVIRVDENSVWVHIPGGVAETPVARTINAKKGDVVQVRVSGGTAFIVGNATAPPTDDAVAIVAQGTAEEAKEVADAATISAEIAATAADSAQASADSAATSAATANTAANNALVQLSTVEDVVGILNWISQHGEYQASTDTAVVPGKFYFTRSGSGTSGDPYVYTVVENPTGNPSTSGYYELLDVDEAVAAFVSSHLVLVTDGLYLIGETSGWKVLISSGEGGYAAGYYLINPSGRNVAMFRDYKITIGDFENDGSSPIIYNPDDPDTMLCMNYGGQGAVCFGYMYDDEQDRYYDGAFVVLSQGDITSADFYMNAGGAFYVNNVKAIDSSGQAIKAVQALKAVGDKNGNDITTTYLKITNGAIGNLNIATETGFYNYAIDSAHAPTTTSGGNLLVIYNGGNYTHQIAEPFGSQDLYVRSKSTNTWSSWKRVGCIDAAPTWTAPTFTSNRATNMDGGFFTIGKMVYVQMIIKMNVGYTSGTTVDHSMIVNNIPAPLVTTAFAVTNRTSGVPVSMYAGYGEGGIRLSIIPSTYPLRQNDELIITGQYIKA